MKKKQKIRLLLIVHLPPPKHGVSIVNEYAESLFRKNNNFEIATIPIRSNKKISNLNDINILKIFYSIKLIFIVLFKVIVFKPKKLYFTPTPKTPVFFRDIVIIIIAKLFKVKIYLHFHRQGLKKLIERNVFSRKLIHFTLKKCTLIHLTPYLIEQEFITSNLNRHTNILFIPNPLVKPPIIIEALKKNNQILFFSNLIPEKGILELIDALPLVIWRKPDLRLIISGGIVSKLYYSEINKRIKELYLGDYISVIPNPDDKSTIKLFNESAIFILPSNEDCFPLVILEALSYDMMVITTKVGGLDTVFTEDYNNIIFCSNNPKELSNSIYKAFITEQKSTIQQTEQLIQTFNANFEYSLINTLSN